LSRSGGCFGCEDIFLEEALVDELFYVPSKDLIMDDLVSLTIMVGAILFRLEK